jgi:ATP-dependent protease Clp ATPase subunit
MHRISAVLKDIIGRFGPTFSLKVLLRNSWPDIVGNDLKNVTSFVEVKYIGKDQINVYINILSSAAILVKHAESHIIYNIKKLTSISEVNLILKASYSLQEFEDAA